MIEIVLESLAEGQYQYKQSLRLLEILIVPRELKKVNFSSKRPTTLKILDMKPSFEKTKCVSFTSFRVKVTND